MDENIFELDSLIKRIPDSIEDYTKYIDPPASLQITKEPDYLREKNVEYEDLLTNLASFGINSALNDYSVLNQQSKNSYDEPVYTPRIDRIINSNNYYLERYITLPAIEPKNKQSIYDYDSLPNLSPVKNFKSFKNINGSQFSSLLAQITSEFIGQSKITPSPSSPFIGNLSGVIDNLKAGSIKPEDLPEMTLPVLEFMEEVKPHIVIGCDRGGSLFGLAMHATWQITRGGQPFPTLDGKLHFARVSKSEDPAIVQEKIDEIVEMSIKQGRQKGNELQDGEQLRVLFVDDWVIGGGTVRLSQKVMEKYGAQTYFAVMCGDGADVTGDPVQNTFVSWHDKPHEIGINYIATVKENDDGTVTEIQKAVPVNGQKAKANRKNIILAARELGATEDLEQVA